MENPVMSNHVDVSHHALDESDNGCIVQADEPPNMLMSAVDNSGCMGTNSSWYWTSMLKLMEQGPGATGPTSNSSCSTNQNAASYGSQLNSFMNGQHAASPTSSSVHDQPIDNTMLTHHASTTANATNDPDSAVWGQEFLSGPIGESSKPSSSNNMIDEHLAACSDDGLHELLYPRTVLELLFSDQLKLEQLTSWPDNRSFALSAAQQFSVNPASLQNMEQQMNVPVADHEPTMLAAAPVHFSSSYSQFDDRLSSSTASSTLSDTTIDQWAVPGGTSAVGQCEHVHAHSSSAMQVPAPIIQPQQQQLQAHQLQFDSTRVKMEYPAVTNSHSNYYNSNLPNNMNTANNYAKFSSPFSNQGGAAAMMNVNESLIINHDINETKPTSLIANKLWPPPSADHNHAHNLITSTRNHSYAALQIRSNNHAAAQVCINGSQQNQGSASDPFVNTQHPVNQLTNGKKSRLEAIKREAMETMVQDTKTNVNIIASSGIEEQKMQLSLEHNFKRPRVDQVSPASLKSQPVRKEKLTERITTLQQLVSPFGKTDTASVLLEAIGYIKFLQEQVQALSSPYFKSAASPIGDNSSSGELEAAKPDLRSRGLCLVPLSCTMQVANDNGADYWYGGAFL